MGHIYLLWLPKLRKVTGGYFALFFLGITELGVLKICNIPRRNRGMLQSIGLNSTKSRICR